MTVPRDADGRTDMAALAQQRADEATALRAEIATRRAAGRGTVRLERQLQAVEADRRAFAEEAAARAPARSPHRYTVLIDPNGRVFGAEDGETVSPPGSLLGRVVCVPLADYEALAARVAGTSRRR